MNSLRIIDACTEEHFAAMSRIHARGWHAAYPGHVPDDYLRDVITEDHWIPFFREDYATGRCRGLLLYDGENPVCCCTCGPVRLGPSPRQSEGLVIHGEAYRGWGEIISFYTDPACTGRGYGSVLMEEALRRLRADGYLNCYVFVPPLLRPARLCLGRDGGAHSLPPRHDLRGSALHQTAIAARAATPCGRRVSRRVLGTRLF